MTNYKLASFFSGLGGLDSGFGSIRGGLFETIWANEFESQIASSFESNHGIGLVTRESITELSSGSVPDTDGIIGGPPCQSWSAAGARRGQNDPRGELFFKYVSLIAAKQPKFFLAENVPGLTHRRNNEALRLILKDFVDAGYNVSYGVMNAADYGVAQDRKRLFIVGYRSDMGTYFRPPAPTSRRTIRDALRGVDPAGAISSMTQTSTSSTECPDNHHFYGSDYFSSIFMSRNRVRGWDEQSFTIQASAPHVPLHPQAPKMEKVAENEYQFNVAAKAQGLYRRLSVRESALIQGFPESYRLHYSSIGMGYRMVGNAVPVPLAAAIATQVAAELDSGNELAAIFGSGSAVSFGAIRDSY